MKQRIQGLFALMMVLALVIAPASANQIFGNQGVRLEGPSEIFLPLLAKDYDPAQWLDLTILHTNDFHARVDEYNRNGARCKEADADAGLCIAGAPRLATLVEDIRAARENVLLLDAGDQFQGTLFVTLFGANVLTTTMNYLGYDAMAIGNHEFDRGPEELAIFIEGADFPVLGSDEESAGHQKSR